MLDVAHRVKYSSKSFPHLQLFIVEICTRGCTPEQGQDGRKVGLYRQLFPQRM